MEDAKKEKLITAFSQVLNSVSAENDSNTPDFILANYLYRCLENYNSIDGIMDYSLKSHRIGSFITKSMDSLMAVLSEREKWFDEIEKNVIVNTPPPDLGNDLTKIG